MYSWRGKPWLITPSGAFFKLFSFSGRLYWWLVRVFRLSYLTLLRKLSVGRLASSHTSPTDALGVIYLYFLTVSLIDVAIYVIVEFNIGWVIQRSYMLQVFKPYINKMNIVNIEVFFISVRLAFTDNRSS